MKKILSNIIFGMVICVFGYLVIANIQHTIYLNKHETFDFDGGVMTNIRIDIRELEDNIEKISKLDDSVFTIDDLKSISDNLSLTLQYVKSSKLLEYEGKQKIYLKDLFIIDSEDNLPVLDTINTLRILAEYDSSINDYLEVYKSDFLNNAYNGANSILKVMCAYRYHTIDDYNAYMIEPDNVGVLARAYRLDNYVVKGNYIAKLVLQIGGANNE